MRYADAGVNISVADEAKRRIAAMAGKTFRRGVLAPIGGFGALFQLDRKRWRDPILVSSADGVGTKLKIAFATGMHSTIGADILNHCVNDILTQGAEPLFFLDYLARGKMDPEIAEQVIEGMSRAAKKAGCSLIGGETAEMPDFYAPGDYDLAGFVVGAVDAAKSSSIPRRVRAGDVLVALLLERPAHQRLFAGAQTGFWRGEARTGYVRGGNREQDRRRAVEAASLLTGLC